MFLITRATIAKSHIGSRNTNMSVADFLAFPATSQAAAAACAREAAGS